MNKDKVARLEAIYARLPRIECRRLCQEYCGPIGMSDLERKRIEKVAHRLPLAGPDLRCNMLSPAGACSVYQLRPMICRLFGLTERLRCPHGCTPSRWLTEKEAAALVYEVQGLSPVSLQRVSR